jgi:hypothetical protein
LFLPNQLIHGSQLEVEGNTLVFYARWEDNPNGTGTSYEEAIPIAQSQKITIAFPAYTASTYRYYKFVPMYTKTYYWTTTGSYTAYLWIGDSNKNQKLYTTVASTSSSITLNKGETYYIRFNSYSSGYP